MLVFTESSLYEESEYVIIILIIGNTDISLFGTGRVIQFLVPPDVGTIEKGRTLIYLVIFY